MATAQERNEHRRLTWWAQADEPATFKALLQQADATGKQRLLQHMSVNLIPIMEKGLLDPIIVHGCA